MAGLSAYDTMLVGIGLSEEHIQRIWRWRPNATPNRWYGLSIRQTTRSHNVDDQNIFQFGTRPCVLGLQLIGRKSAARGRLGILQRL